MPRVINVRKRRTSGYRYHRVYIASAVSGNEINVAEIKLMIGGVDQLPTMSSETSGSVTVSASSEHATDQEWKAADDNAGTNWDNNSVAGAAWWKVDWGAGNTKQLTSYSVQANNIFLGNICPGSLKLQGSNDNSIWTDLESAHTGLSWTSGETKTYTL